MALYALENGKLVEAPGNAGASGKLADVIVDAVQSQTLALVQHPLFPIGYVTNRESHDPAQSLIALDATKRVITIEVLRHLNSETLLHATSRSGYFATLNRQQLAEIYPGTEQDFAHRWNLFLENTSPAQKPTARLYLFCLSIDEAVKNSLCGLGVEAKLVLPHEGLSGTLIEVAEAASYGTNILAKAPQPWMIEAPQPAEPAAPQTHTVDQSLWNIEGWADRSGVAPLPYHQREAQESPRVVLPEPEIDPIVSATEEPAQAKESLPQRREDTAIMLAELTDPPRKLGRRARRRAAWNSDQPMATPASPESSDSPDTAIIPSIKPAFPIQPPAPRRGKSLYEQMMDHKKRAEQRLWDESAPNDFSEKLLISERDSAAESSRAVELAAENDQTALPDWMAATERILYPPTPPKQAQTDRVTRRSRRRRQA